MNLTAVRKAQHRLSSKMKVITMISSIKDLTCHGLFFLFDFEISERSLICYHIYVTIIPHARRMDSSVYDLQKTHDPTRYGNEVIGKMFPIINGVNPKSYMKATRRIW